MDDDLKKEIPDTTSHVDIPEPPVSPTEPMSTIIPGPEPAPSTIPTRGITQEPTLPPTPTLGPALEVQPAAVPADSIDPNAVKPRNMSDLLAGLQPPVEPVAASDKLNPVPAYPYPSDQTVNLTPESTPPPPADASVIPAPVVTEAVTTPAAPNSGFIGKLTGLLKR